MRRIAIAALLALSALAGEAQIKISALPNYSGAADSAMVPVVIGGINRRVYGQDLGKTRFDSIVAALAGKHPLLGYTPVPDTRTITFNGQTYSLAGDIEFEFTEGGGQTVFLRLEDFDGAGDGVTDNSPALQAIWDYIEANPDAQAYEIRAGPGNYKFNSSTDAPLTLGGSGVNQRIRLSGNNARFFTTTAGVTIIRRLPADATEANLAISDYIMTVENVEFQGTNAGGQKALDLGAGYSWAFRDNNFTNFDTAMILRFHLQPTIDNNRFTNNKDENIVLKYGDIWGGGPSNSATNSPWVVNNRVFGNNGAYSHFHAFAVNGVFLMNFISEGSKPFYNVILNGDASTNVAWAYVKGVHLEAEGGTYAQNTSFRIRSVGVFRIEDTYSQYDDTLFNSTGSTSSSKIIFDGITYTGNLPAVAFNAGGSQTLAYSIIFRNINGGSAFHTKLFTAASWAGGVLPIELHLDWDGDSGTGTRNLASGGDINFFPGMSVSSKKTNTHGHFYFGTDNTYSFGGLAGIANWRPVNSYTFNQYIDNSGRLWFGSATVTPDVGMSRSAAGQLSIINNGFSDWRDLKLRDLISTRDLYMLNAPAGKATMRRVSVGSNYTAGRGIHITDGNVIRWGNSPLDSAVVVDQNSHGITFRNGIFLHGQGGYLDYSTPYGYIKSDSIDGFIAEAGNGPEGSVVMASANPAGFPYAQISATGSGVIASVAAGFDFGVRLSDLSGRLYIPYLIDSAQGYSLHYNPTTDKVTYSSGAPWGGDFGSTSSSSSTSLTLTTHQVYVFTGTSEATWTMPALATRAVFVKNNGEANLIVQRAGSDQLWTDAAVTSLTLEPGQGAMLAGVGGYWSAVVRDRSSYGDLSATDLSADNVTVNTSLVITQGASAGRFLKSSDVLGTVEWADLPELEIGVGAHGELDAAEGNIFSINDVGMNSIVDWLAANPLLTLAMFLPGEFEDFASGTVSNGETHAVSGDVVYDYLVAGYQPLDADLTSWAGVTRASGFDTWAATPSSANLRSLLTDETGTGSAVFSTDPTFGQDVNITRDLAVNGRMQPNLYSPNSFNNAKGLGFGVIMEPLAVPFTSVNTTHSVVDGSCRCTMSYLAKDTTLTGMKYFLVSAGAITGDNNNKFGIYSVNTGTGLATRVAQSASDETFFESAAGLEMKTIPFSSPYSATQGYYLMCYLYNVSAAAVPPTFAAGTQSDIFNNTSWFSTGLTTNYSVTAQTDLPTSIDLTTAAKTNHKQYVTTY
jgi:hypothetical protein